MYTVTLYENENMPYVIKDIEANNENEATQKAKEFVATHGYFPYLTEEQIMNVLLVENVVYDCEYCSRNVDCGGKCNHFEYNCPFTIVENYDSEKLKSIRVAIGKISEAIEQLKELDTENYMEDDIDRMSFQLSYLEDKVSEDTEKEWNEIIK